MNFCLSVMIDWMLNQSWGGGGRVRVRNKTAFYPSCILYCELHVPSEPSLNEKLMYLLLN